MIYSFSYIKEDGTVYCQMMRTSKKDACHILDTYAKLGSGEISDSDLFESKQLINNTDSVESHKQVTFCGKTLSVCIQSD